MIASLNHSSSASSLGSALMSGATFTVRPSRQATEEHGRVLLLIDPQANAATRSCAARRWRFAVHAVRLVLDCSKAIVGFLCARVNAVPVRSSPPITLATLTSAWRAARHRERERIKSDVGLAEEGKRIGRPTISRRLRERVAERIAAGEAASRVAKEIRYGDATAQ